MPGLDFGTLALLSAVGFAGPVLASLPRLRIPAVVGELTAGIVIGRTGFGVVDATDPTFALFANIGFASVMLVVGTHVRVRGGELRSTLPVTAQIAIADTACIVVLPLVIDIRRLPEAAGGALAVTGCAIVLFVGLRAVDRRGWRRRVHVYSEKRRFARELRTNLVVLFALAALAVRTHVSILLAGFALGMVIAVVGEPHRLARQLFGITEGFFSPLFFVWLGASLQVRELGAHPKLILLGICLGVGGVLSAAQLGVPVAAAATIGTEGHLLAPGEASALLLGALITIAAATIAGALAARDPAAAPVAATAQTGKGAT